MKKIKDIENGYDYIESLDNGNQIFIDFLKRFNELYDNLKKYNTGFDYDIVIENVPENYKYEVFDSIYNLLNIHGLKLSLDDYKKRERICIHMTEKSLYRLPGFNYRTDKDNNIRIYTLSTKVDDYELLFGENYDQNKYLVLSYGECEKETAIKDLKLKLKNNLIKTNLSLQDFENLYDNLLLNGNCSSIGFCDYSYSLIVKWMIENNKTILDKSFLKSYETEEEIEIILDDLVGLQNVKEEINKLKKYVSYCKNNNIDISKTYLNMFFLGNPGTGRTTVAKLMGQELYDLGIIEENKVVSVVPNDLIGKYVGHTKDTIRKVLNDAKGGILFIDEAYNMLSAKEQNGGMFMKEAVEELLKYLEEPKNIVIFGGYKNEMINLYKINPGLKSRIYKEIYFNDFSKEELMSIIRINLSKYNLKLGANSNTISKILDVLDEAKNDDSFGNARFCEKFAQDIFINHINNNLNSNMVSIKDISIYKNNSAERMGF